MMVWVTGAGGFLGRNLCHALVRGGHIVVELSRNSKEFPIDLAEPNTLALLEKFSKNAGQPDVVIHLASRQPGTYQYVDFVKSNVMTTANLLNFVAKTPPKLFIYTSTISVYARPPCNPVDENGMTRACSPYTATKLAAENLIAGLNDLSCRFVTFRLPSLYGIGQSDSFIDGLAKQIRRGHDVELFDQGKRIRDVLPVNDVVTAILNCLNFESGYSHVIYNLGCGESVTANEFAEKLVHLLGSSSRIILGNRTNNNSFDIYLDIEQARREIKFMPTPWGEALERYVHELST